MPQPLPTLVRSAEQGALSERDFYALYDWCLNPILSIDQLFQRLIEELDRYDNLRVEWQRQESRINLYLFICAITCTVDDYLAWRPANIPAPLDVPWVLARLILDQPIARWRHRWQRSVDHVCELIVSHDLEPAPAASSDVHRRVQLRDSARALATARLPHRLLRWRMRVPEGFRCQDLTHHDVYSLARHFAETQTRPADRVVVIGPRTAGAYFAPLAKAYLSARGWPRISWLTIRPKVGLSWWEWRALRAARASNAQFLVIDDHPNTGFTFRRIFDLLRRLGVPPSRIVLCAPRHPAEPTESLLRDAPEAGKVCVVRLEPDEFYKQRWLHPDAAKARIQEYFADRGQVCVEDDEAVRALNAQLHAHYRDGFHVRLKRVFRVSLHNDGDLPSIHHLFVKSVGWGWLGYHAYLAGMQLADYVPRLVGLRDGLLATEWMGSLLPDGPLELPPSPRVTTLGTYVARRMQRLPLAEDPCSGSVGYRWSGWDALAWVLRGVYGRAIGRLAVPALRRRLRRYVSPVPTFVDGRMRPDDWIATPSGARKVDFEHHNFGGAESDVVDPAWDLASASFEFTLSDDEEETLLLTYAQETADHTVVDRIILYQLLYGTRAMNDATYALARVKGDAERAHWNKRYLQARTFLITRLNRFLAGPNRRQQAQWFPRLFFLDLDGVFDGHRFGVPHTTPSGLAALDLLRSGGVSVITNTGRSIDDVRDYCAVYGLPGGVAEFGSVFVDAVQDRTVPLIDTDAAAQVERCRAMLQTIPGVSMDDGYRYSVRAYRWQGPHMAALEPREIHQLLTQCEADRLTIIRGLGDCTHITQKGVSKGTAVAAVRQYLDGSPDLTAAMGDSDQDLDLLEQVDFAYAPANCAQSIRSLARRGRCRVMRQPLQRGLLAAARHLRSQASSVAAALPSNPTGGKGEHIVRVLLRIGERPFLQRVASALWLEG